MRNKYPHRVKITFSGPMKYIYEVHENKHKAKLSAELTSAYRLITLKVQCVSSV